MSQALARWAQIGARPKGTAPSSSSSDSAPLAATIASAPATSGNPPPWDKSPIELAYGELQGALSARALEEHYALYRSYIDKVNAASAGLEDLSGLPTEAQPLAYRGLKFECASAAAAVVLHEAYFTGLTDKPVPPTPAGLAAALTRDLGPAWFGDLAQAVLASRGWAVIGWGFGELHLFTQDDHNGGVAGYLPIIAIDAYEHAYWMDHGTDKKSYVAALRNFFNWPELESRFTAAGGR